MLLRLGVVCSGLAFAGCSDVALGVDAPAGSLLVIAAADSQGRLLRVDRIEPGSTRSLFLAPEGTDSLHLYSIEGNGFVLADGSRVDATQLAALRARPLTEQSSNPEGCGRCPVPALSPPEVVLPGSSCALPPWVRVASQRVFDDGLEELADRAIEPMVRAQFVIDWPGACPCTTSLSRRATRSVRLDCLVKPKETLMGEAIWDRFGNFVGISGESIVVASAGANEIFEITKREVSNALGLIGTSTRSSAFTVVSGRTTGEGVTRSARFENFSYDPSAAPAERFQESEPWVLVAPVIPRHLLSLGSGEFLLSASRITSGFGLNQVPSLFRCKDPPGVECTELELERCSTDNGGLNEVVLLDDGTGLSSGPKSLYVKEADSEVWRCRARIETAELAGHTYAYGRIGRGFQLRALERQIYLCGRFHRLGENGPEVSGMALLTARTDDLGDDPDAPRVRMVWFAEGGSSCASTWMEGKETLLYSFGGGPSVEVDARGEVVGEYGRLTGEDGPAPELRELPRLVDTVSSDGDWQFAAIDHSSFFRRARGGTFQQLRGPTEEDPQSATAIEPIEDRRFVWLHGPHVARTIDVPRGASSCDEVTVSAPAFPLLDDRSEDDAQVSTRDSRGLERFAVSGVTGSRSWLRIVDLESSSILEDITLPFGGLSVRDLEEWAPGRFVLIGPTGELFLLSGADLEPLHVDYDDPSTVDEEREPATTGYRPAYSVLGGQNGVLWAGGDQRLARILAGPPGSIPRVEGFWLERSLSQKLRERTYKDDAFGQPEITTVSAICPDRVIVGWREVPGATLSDEPDLSASISYLTIPSESECAEESRELLLCEHSARLLTTKLSDVNDDRPRLLGYSPATDLHIVTSESFGTLGLAESGAAIVTGGRLGRIRVRVLDGDP